MILAVTDRVGGLGGDDLWLSRRDGQPDIYRIPVEDVPGLEQ